MTTSTEPVTPPPAPPQEDKERSWWILPTAFALIGFAVLQVTWRNAQVELPPAAQPIIAGWTAPQLEIMFSLSPPPKLPPSLGNKYADDERAAALGQRLFFDTRLSANGHEACSRCHLPLMHFADGLPVGQGIRPAKRNTPTLLYSQWSPFLFWDGRADSAWAQALGPIENPDEHGMTRVQAARLLWQHYRADYEAIFGPLPPMDDTTRFPERARPIPLERQHPDNLAWEGMAAPDQDAINRVFANFGKSIEAYTRKLTPGLAPFDKYVQALQAGDPKGGGHLSESAERGLRAFIGPAQCVNCHHGPLLTDFGFHNLGLPNRGMPGDNDLGRSVGAQQVLADPFRCGGPYSDATRCDELTYLEPTFQDFLGAFKTPSLRNVAETGPYMHDGRFKTLEEVMAFYKTLPGPVAVGHRELVLTLLDERVDSRDLIEFLKSLSAPLPDAPWLQDPHGAR